MAKAAANKKRLSDIFIRKTQPNGQAFLIWDTKQSGLVLRVEASGRKAYKCHL